MWYQILIPGPVLMIPILVMTTKGTHSPKNDSNMPSDVIVTYSNHAEAGQDDRIIQAHDTTTSTTSSTTTKSTLLLNDKRETTRKSRKRKQRPRKESSEGEEQKDVIFIPNEREQDNTRVRNEYYLQNERASLSELMGGHKTVEDLLAASDVRLETESPVSDIIFVTGKNNENMDRGDKTKTEELQGDDYRAATTRRPRLNCAKLNCNNFLKSVCGEKTDDNYQQRFRLFLNECYFRKVNCNFKNPSNRFKRVPLENCKNIGAHTQIPFTFSVKPAPKPDTSLLQLNNSRRSSSSRRSTATNIHGQFCSHPCPVTCPEHYEPVCAVSSTGRHRVFVNHCALDFNSCSFGIVWHSVPLAECVGGKKADMRQNAGFIGWMQRVGIVDNRGRLVYDT